MADGKATRRVALCALTLLLVGSVACGKRRRPTEEIAAEAAGDTWGPLKNGSLFIVVDDLDDEALLYFLDHELPELEPGAPIQSISLFGERVTERSLRPLFASPRIGKVNDLFFSIAGIGARELELIAAQPWARDLELFRLGGSALDHAALSALQRLLWANTKITTLKLSNVRFRAHALEALCMSDKATLDITRGRFAGNQVARLLECSPFREVRCKECEIGPGELATLTHMSPSLEVLDLQVLPIFDADIEALGAADAHLRELHIDRAPCLSDRSLIALNTSTWFGDLERLTISGEFSNAEIERLELAWFPRSSDTLRVKSSLGLTNGVCQDRVDREARIAHTAPE